MPALPKARLTFNEWIAYQPLSASPVDISPRPFSRNLVTDEQIWRREAIAGNDWARAPLGWLDDLPVAEIIITNEEGKFTQVQPSHEERAAAEARIIEVGIEANGTGVIVPITLVRPHHSFHLEPLGPIYLRCQTDRAKYTIIAVPG